MHCQFVFDHVDEGARASIEQRIREGVEKRIAGQAASLGFPEATLTTTVRTRDKPAEQFEVRLRIHLPRRRVIVAHAQATTVEAAIDAALQRLEREIERHGARLRNHHAWRRKARRERLRARKARIAALPVDVVQDAQSSIEAVLPRLRRTVSRELMYLRAEGELAGDYPSVDDVMDEAVATVIADGGTPGDAEALFVALSRAAHEVMDAERLHAAAFGDHVSLESAPPLDAEDQAEAMVEEEFGEFYQPDAGVWLEAVIADGAAINPEQALSEQEQLYVIDVLRDLPAGWRRALMLWEVEGLAPAEIGEIFKVPVAEVQAWVDGARRFVHARLDEAGIVIVREKALFVALTKA